MKFLFLFFIVKCLSVSLEGTWMSKSGTVKTGPDFYDPIDELIFEPSLPGVCYSFDGKGYWEKAIYQVSSNPINPKCPTATILWQHGTYTEHDNGKLILKPFKSDGRKLFSDPCNADESIYMRYEEQEILQKYVIEYDSYHSKHKLQLYAWDGSKMQPLWIQYKPPVMLPKTILNPTSKGEAQHQTRINERLKRSIENRGKTDYKRADIYDKILFHSISVGLLSFGFICVWLLIKRLTPKHSLI